MSRWPTIAAALVLGAAGGVLGALVAMRAWDWATFWSAAQAIATAAAFGAAFWYARIARRQTDSIVSQQLLAESQQRLAEKDYIERNKPIVYIDRVDEGGGAFRYVVRNVGGGFAVNTYVFNLTLDDRMASGSLAAGAERTLPDLLNQLLCNNGAGSRHLVIAEGAFSRTSQWTATLNLRTQTAGDNRGQVIHRSASVTTEPPRFTEQTLGDYLSANIDAFRRQLLALTEG